MNKKCFQKKDNIFLQKEKTKQFFESYRPIKRKSVNNVCE